MVGRDTNPDAIDSALRRLLRERHAANRALAPARVLNLIVVVDRACKDAIAERLEHVGRYEASRTILCTVEDGRRTLDAAVVMSYTEPSDGGLGLVHEKVEIEMGLSISATWTRSSIRCSPPSCRPRSGALAGTSAESRRCSGRSM